MRCSACGHVRQYIKDTVKGAHAHSSFNVPLANCVVVACAQESGGIGNTACEIGHQLDEVHLHVDTRHTTHTIHTVSAVLTAQER